MKLKYILTTLIFTLNFLIQAKPVLAEDTIEILRLPLPKKSKEYVIYTIDKPKKCLLSQSSNPHGVIYNSSNKSFKQFSFLEEIYFKIKKTSYKNNKLSLNLSLASNISFLFTYKDCNLSKAILIDDVAHSFDKIDITYRSALGAPVLDYFTISNNGKKHKLYQHVLKDHTPIYELKIGPAISIRTNLRPKNEKKFHKNNPVMEPIPAFIFRYGNIFINKDGLGTALYAGHGITALVAAIRDGEPYKRQGLKDRTLGTMIGPILKYNNFQLHYMKNWTEKEKGSEFKLTYSYEYRPTKNFHLIPRVYLQVWDKKYSDYYTGIDEDEAIYNVYRGKRSFNYSAMMRALYHSERIIYLADFGMKFLDKDIYNSPIITKKIEFRATLGVLYRAF